MSARLLGGVIIGLVVGVTVGIAVGEGGFTDAAWAFVGVIFGAAFSLVVEWLRAEQAKKARQEEVRLDHIDRLSKAMTEVEQALIPVFTARLGHLDSDRTFPTPVDTDSGTQVFASALLAFRLAVGAFLSEGLEETATAYREATHRLVFFVPPGLDVTVPLDQAGMNLLLREVADISLARSEATEIFLRDLDYERRLATGL
jgi:hypothetical protein